MKKLRNNKGITLVALVVTIIILLILAGVALSAVLNHDGIFNRAENARVVHEIGEEKEIINLSMNSLKIGKKEEAINLGTPETLVTPEELKAEMDKGSPKPASVETGEETGDLIVTFDQSRNNRSYIVKQTGEVMSEAEASQIIDIIFEGKFLVTAGGDIIKSNITEGKLFDKANITDERINTGGVRKVYWNLIVGKNGKLYEYNEYDELPICISDIEGSVLKGKNIVDIEANIVKDRNGKIYLLKDDNSVICMSDDSTSELYQKSIEKIYSLGDTYAVIDKEGKVYTWGENSNGELGAGIEGERSDVPICISNIDESPLKGKNITSIDMCASYYSTIVAKDNQGKLYTWGSNNSGKLGAGIGNDRYISRIPICISDIDESPLKGKNIIDYYVNTNIIIAKDNQGKLYTWGSNFRGKLGAGIEEDSNIPICISDIDESPLKEKNIIEICTDIATIAKDNNGKLYTWGTNADGILGDGTDEDSNIPICISDIDGSPLKGKNIVNIYYLGSNVTVQDTEGNVYVWGLNFDNQLGAGIEEDHSNIPICINTVNNSELNGKKIRKIISWNGFISYITENNECYFNIVNVPTCLAAGTTINTSKGLTKIEEIEKGDKVYTYNEQENKIEETEVIETQRFLTDILLHLVFKDGEKIITAEDHTFYVENAGIKEGRELKIGDKLITSNNETIEITNIEKEEKINEYVYNITVKDNHNYFVGNNKILVQDYGAILNHYKDK